MHVYDPEANVLPDDSVRHRVGGGKVENLFLRPLEEKLIPPGFSVLLGGTPAQAAVDMRRVFGPTSKMSQRASAVGTATIESIREIGFDVIADETNNFPNHGRLIHPTDGIDGFSEEKLRKLSALFFDHEGL